jgi:glyceraldehyde 3-phosphate dehydrogenase
MEPKYAVYQLSYDTVHGRFPGKVECTDKSLVVNGREVHWFMAKDPKDIPWGSVGAEYVCESTGVFIDTPKATGHITGGAKKVIISAPPKDGKFARAQNGVGWMAVHLTHPL